MKEGVFDIGYLSGKLKACEELWDSFYYDQSFLIGKLNIEADRRSNYIDDIFQLLHDTLPVLNFTSQATKLSSHIVKVSGVLQVFYFQQDLIIELSNRFGVNGVNMDVINSKKELVRKIRNELSGHPINYGQGASKQSKLESSVFWNRSVTSGFIEYKIYHRENNFLSEQKAYEISHIINEQYSFLIYAFQEIERKLKEICLDFVKHIEDKSSHLKKAGMEVKIKLAFQIFPGPWAKHVLSPQILNECLNKSDESPRYSHALNQFSQEFEILRNDTIIDYSTFGIEDKPCQLEGYRLLDGSEIPEDHDMPVNTIVVLSEIQVNDSNNYRYLLSKINERSADLDEPIYDDIFNETPEIRAEFEHLRENQDSDLEYYSAYEYLKYLLSQLGN